MTASRKPPLPKRKKCVQKKPFNPNQELTIKKFVFKVDLLCKMMKLESMFQMK